MMLYIKSNLVLCMIVLLNISMDRIKDSRFTKPELTDSAWNISSEQHLDRRFSGRQRTPGDRYRRRFHRFRGLPVKLPNRDPLNFVMLLLNAETLKLELFYA